MTTIPMLNNYDVNVLVAIGNQTSDIFARNRIKMLIVEKLLLSNYSMLFLINKFRNSSKILKESYAEVIIMTMKDKNYFIDMNILLEIISMVSLDTLMYYGMDSCSLILRERCKNEFWNRAYDIEDKFELDKKGKMGKIKRRNKKNRKGDKNDKY